MTASSASAHLPPDRTIPTGLAASFTSDPIARVLNDLGHDVTVSDFNQIHAVCLDPDASFGRRIERLVVVWRIEDMFEADLLAWLGGQEQARQRLSEAIDELASIVSRASHDHRLSVLLALPPQPVGFGIDPLDPTWSSRLASLVADARTTVSSLAETQESIRMIDHGRLVDVFGGKAHDRRNQLLYRQPYSSRFVQFIAREVGRELDAFEEPPPKAIVLDADNTLWGGIVGEEGVAGLELGGSFPGVAYRHFQVAMKSLQAQGVLLAIASKNDEHALMEVFRDRTEMVLNRSDIAAWRVNWNRKSDSIKEIAEELNIGLDSVVFIDDSDFEIAEVAAQFPEVRCLRVPDDVEALPDLVAGTGWFRSLSVSQEDRARTMMIQTERLRRDASATLSHADFLDSLQLSVSIARSDPLTAARVTQLINKTNQFNLTTVRRDAASVSELLKRDDVTIYAASVDDRFGSYGLVGVVITIWTESEARIDTFLMSCRVLKRGVESALLASVAADAAARGVPTLIGQYVRTAKNGQVAGFYEEHGFDVVGDGYFALKRPDRVLSPRHISVVDA